MATIGTGGCGWERQLEAVERALTVHALPGGENDGFLRDEALLAVVLMTDEDDCAVADSRIFGDDDSLGPLGMRCFNNPDLQTPVADLVESVRRVKAQADRMVFAGIVGVPPDLASESPDFAAVLADERMQLTVDFSPEGGGNRFVPTCDVDGVGIAFAPRRIVEWLGGLDDAGSEAIVQSICQADLAGPAGAVARAIERKLLLPDCTSAAVSSADRPLHCALYETRWDRSACGGAAIDRGIVGDARVCQICQRSEGETDAFGFDVSACPGDAGWRYVADAPQCRAGGLVELTPGSEPAPTSSVYLECRWPA